MTPKPRPLRQNPAVCDRRLQPLCSPCLCGECLPTPDPRPVTGFGNRRPAMPHADRHALPEGFDVVVFRQSSGWFSPSISPDLVFEEDRRERVSPKFLISHIDGFPHVRYNRCGGASSGRKDLAPGFKRTDIPGKTRRGCQQFPPDHRRGAPHRPSALLGDTDPGKVVV